MTPMLIIRDTISKTELKRLAQERFGDMIKAVVDIERGIFALAGELHADEEQLLLEDGSLQENLWGINLYPDDTSDQWIEFDSMINLRPSQGNSSRSVESAELQKKICQIVASLVSDA